MIYHVCHSLHDITSAYISDLATHPLFIAIHTLVFRFLISESESESDSVVSDSLPLHGILQTRILDWVAFSLSMSLPNPGIEPRSPALLADSLPAEPQGKLKWHMLYQE